MELLFLYINDFRKIKHQSFSFCSDLNFKLTEVNGVKKRKKFELHISKNESYVNLFDKNILGVTGIVGKNGAGKSSIINAIKMLKGNLIGITSALIFTVRDNKSKKLYTCFYNGGSLTEMPRLEVGVSYDNEIEQLYSDSVCSGYFIKEISGVENLYVENMPFSLNDINLCYFSNALDSQNEMFFGDIFNLSTNYRLEKFLEGYINRVVVLNKRQRRQREINPLFSHLGQYQKSELKSMLSFLSYAKTRKTTNNLPQLPETIVFTFERDDVDFLLEDGESYLLNISPFLKRLDQIAGTMFKALDNPATRFSNLVMLSTFYHILRWRKFSERERSDVRDIVVFLANEPDSMFFVNLRQIMTQQLFTSNLLTDGIGLRSLLSDHFFALIDDLEFINFRKLGSDIRSFEVGVSNKLWPILSMVHDIQQLDSNFFVDYQWGGGLSTGQEAFIAHFARLYDVKRKMKSRPIWLLIDEGDLHFHPEMQKGYFKELLSFLNFLYPKNKIQVILATHSPFIVSDLPKQNLLFMKQDASGNCGEDLENIRQNTFGANIHDLFKDSLFLSGSLIGDFAKDKIQELIDWCLSNNKSIQRAAEVRKTIAIIGEPIIRTKLAEMVATKMGDNEELARLEQQELYIRERIAEIRRKDDQNKR